MGTIQHPTSGEVLVIDDIVVQASTLRSASGQTTALALGDKAGVRLLLDVTVDNGTTLDVVMETSFDGSTDWRSMGAFTQVSAVSAQRKTFGVCDRWIRANYTIVGTSWTFSITGEAV